MRFIYVSTTAMSSLKENENPVVYEVSAVPVRASRISPSIATFLAATDADSREPIDALEVFGTAAARTACGCID